MTQVLIQAAEAVSPSPAASPLQEVCWRGPAAVVVVVVVVESTLYSVVC